MKNNSKKPIKSVFIVSLQYRRTTPIANPEPNKPKYKIAQHEITFMVIDNVAEMIRFLDRYTDFDKNLNSDVLAKKWFLKNYIRFSWEIKDRELLKNEILADIPRRWDDSFFDDYYPEHNLHIDRVPLGIQKLTLDKDLF